MADDHRSRGTKKPAPAKKAPPRAKKVTEKKTATDKKKAIGPKPKTDASGKMPRGLDGSPSAIIGLDANQSLTTKHTADFPIVGIGASAGGLEALERFFKAMPVDAGIGFVVVLHLDPTHISVLPELLQKRTKMPVCHIVDGMRVERDHVYVIPPNMDLTMMNGTLQLTEQTLPRGANLPIDTFLRSLALDQRSAAVCIILSGTGTDGTLGLKAVKGEVGMVMVQDEDSAKYEGMPRSAMATGLVDYVLPPDKMPMQLIKYVRHATGHAGPAIGPDEGPIPQALNKIFVILRARTRHDFSLYKKNTICRRIERRMSVHQINDISEYLSYLQQSEHEANILFKELLIGVTNFFRDPEAFELLQSKVLPKLLAGKPDDYTIRVWVPGCSSGEECYSLAIALHECMEQLGRHFHVQIFGTDIDASAINLARAGLYPESILADVGPERIRRYFTKEDGGHYRVSAQIREMLVFAPQNVAQDPPFTKLDLLSCRNLLIYLGTELQRKLLPMFHYCLKADGILFLGSSETIGPYSGMFSVSHKKWKVFRRKPISQTAHSAMDFPIQPFSKPDLDLDVPEVVQRAEELSALQLVETILQQIDTPPSAIINEAGDIVYIHGRTGRFLEPAEGKISAKIVEMARPGLKKELADAIRDVSTTRQETIYKGLEVQNNEGKVFLTLTVKPILEQSNVRSLIMIVFEETSAPAKKEKSKVKPVRPIDVTKTIEELHRELQDSRESLQSTIEELETSNEELKSTNEELQSTNEESVTVNTELQSRIEDLSKATDDMKNLLDSTGIATIFLDSELRVRRFTPKATEIIPLTATDSGRPINHLATTLIDVDLAEQSLRVLDDLIVRQSDVMSRDGTSFTMRVRPYRTVANVIDGVVITLEDVSKSKQAGQLFQHLVEFAPVAMVIVDEQGEIVLANAVTETLFGYSREELLGRPVEMLIPAPLRRRHVSDRKAYMDEPQMRAMGAALDLHGLRKDGSEVRVEVSLRPITIDRKVLVASAIVDITERRQEEEMLTMLFELSSDPLVLIDMETAGIFEFNQSAHEQLGYTREEFSRLAIRDIEAVDSAGDFVRHIDRFDANGSDVFETKHRTKSDEIRDFRVNGRVVSMGLKKFLVSTWCDITPSDGN